MKELCYLGEPVLRKKCKQVKEITPFIHKVVKELIETVKAQNGAGLAAPQIGYDLRIFVNVFGREVDGDGFPNALEQPEVYINPKITRFSKKKFVKPEGCLSIPDVTLDVARSYDVDIEYTNLKGERVVSKKEHTWRAKCLQHELDHLDGILFIDLLSKEQLKEAQSTLIALEKKTKDRKNASVMPKDFFS
ncbi:MAG: Peptide deformylase [Chlamydiia bacterium]|nr:Peptide deformylase [Chlamydiia bacterium]MCH9618058.1 Peptide deformylase [Chlamydiia bacterium]MCH9624688.1 Peptide deformylase [Chlamydiia bacterium]